MSSTRVQSQFFTATPISSFDQCHISFRLLCSSVTTFIWSKYCRGNHISAADWAVIHGIHYRKILRNSYRKLSWVGFEPTTTEFCTEALTNCIFGHEFNSQSDPSFYSYSNFIFSSMSYFISATALVSLQVYFIEVLFR